MSRKFSDFIKSLKPISNEQKAAIESISGYVGKDDLDEIKELVKLGKVGFLDSNYFPKDVSTESITLLEARSEDVKDFVVVINKTIMSKSEKTSFSVAAGKAGKMITSEIAPNIHGFEMVKKALALQLFASEPVHILLLGDPGTGKTDMIRSASALHPISSFGLGSGTSGAGLTVTVQGNEISKGLLPMADNGICAIDELNLLEQKDRGSLYNAMEKGFVTYDKGGKHLRFDARVRVCATANPKGDKFVGDDTEELKKQLPFDSALLTRFHLVFLIRKPGLEEFMSIAKKIIRSKKAKETSDNRFIRDYVGHAEKLIVEVPQELEAEIAAFVSDIKKDEDNYLVEISPRLVIGFIRLAKASARMRLSGRVVHEDIDAVKEIVADSLKIRK